MSGFELVLYALASAVILFAFNWKARREAVEVDTDSRRR